MKFTPFTTILVTALISTSGLAMAHNDDHTSALGEPGDAKKVSRTVDITVSDTMRFSPASISAKKVKLSASY